MRERVGREHKTKRILCCGALVRVLDPMGESRMRSCSLRFDTSVYPEGEWVVIFYNEAGKDVGDRWNRRLSAAVVVMEAWITDGKALDEIALNN